MIIFNRFKHILFRLLYILIDLTEVLVRLEQVAQASRSERLELSLAHRLLTLAEHRRGRLEHAALFIHLQG